MASVRLHLLIALSFIAHSLQQDPVVNFCRRWGHQTAQVDGRLYIDGGQVAYNSIRYNDTNDWLLFSDLNSRSDAGMPRQYYNASKPANVPRLSGGYLWADETNKCFYQFGGEYAGGSTPKEFGMWTYDVILNQWNTTTLNNVDRNLVRPSYGAGAQFESRGLGFYYGGWVNNRTTPGWNGLSMALSSMVQFDFTTGVLKNITSGDGIGRAEGQMVFLPVSDGGLLIYFGGVEDPYRNGTPVATAMSKIRIFDINSGRWYTQTASGDVPPSRRQFGAGVMWADDRSSFNIYIYGGYGFDTLAFDDVYILSLPSFKWFKSYSSDNSAGHGGCSANVVTRNQMLIIGGWHSNTTFTNCDAPETQGQHNLVLGNDTGKAENPMWDTFDPKRSKYVVPPLVVSAIGGGPTGGATVTAPLSWDSNDLKAYYKISSSYPTRTATRALRATSSASPAPAGGKKKNLGAIIGGVLGGLVALIAILCLILFCLHRRKRARQTDASANVPMAPPAELAVTPIPHEMSNTSASKYVAVHERQESADHTVYSTLAPVQSRSISYDQASAHSSNPHQSYHTAPPVPPTQYGSPHDTHSNQRASPPSYPPPNAELFLPNDRTGHEAHQAAWHQQPSPPPSTTPRQRQYSYPTPSSPQQPQIYYPPPEDPAHHQQSQSSPTYHRGSPTATQYSGDNQHVSQNTSNMTTPAQFYAQPVPTQRMHEGIGYGNESLQQAGYGAMSNHMEYMNEMERMQRNNPRQ